MNWLKGDGPLIEKTLLRSAWRRFFRLPELTREQAVERLKRPSLFCSGMSRWDWADWKGGYWAGEVQDLLDSAINVQRDSLEFRVDVDLFAYMKERA